jgi:hypothetical protein
MITVTSTMMKMWMRVWKRMIRTGIVLKRSAMDDLKDDQDSSL